jgi:4-amino-4-deoxy-L-arabinose transferase-like glycosyltransferase
VNRVVGSVGRKEWLWATGLSLAAAWLFLANLGDQRLWDDEAQTALIAKTVMTDGVPRGYDGRNFFSQELGREYGRNYVYRWHTWLSFYLVAAAFSVCGVSEWTARIPFALMGLATVPLCYWFARSLWQSRRAAVLASLLLGTSVPFLILSRQCRYYSPCALFSLLGLIAYYQWMRGRRWGPLAFVVSAVLLFHSLFLYWAVLVIAVLIHAAIFHRDRLIKVAVWSGVTLLLNAPWLVWLLSPPRVGGYPDRNDPWTWPFSIFNRYMTETYLHAFSPLLLVLLAVVGAVAKVREKKFVAMSADTVRSASLLLLFISVNYAFLCMATPLYFFRYLAPAIPLLCLLAAKILDSAMRLHWSLGTAALALILLLGSLPDYLYEITHHYSGPVDGMVQRTGRRDGGVLEPTRQARRRRGDHLRRLAAEVLHQDASRRRPDGRRPDAGPRGRLGHLPQRHPLRQGSGGGRVSGEEPSLAAIPEDRAQLHRHRLEQSRGARFAFLSHRNGRPEADDLPEDQG